VHVAVTHVPLASGLEAVTRSEAIAGVVTTDSVGTGMHRYAPSPAGDDKLVTLSIGPLFGQAVRRMQAGKPLAPLLRGWPLAPGE